MKNKIAEEMNDEKRRWDICPVAYQGCVGASVRERFESMCLDNYNGCRKYVYDYLARENPCLEFFIKINGEILN